MFLPTIAFIESCNGDRVLASTNPLMHDEARAAGMTDKPITDTPQTTDELFAASEESGGPPAAVSLPTKVRSRREEAAGLLAGMTIDQVIEVNGALCDNLDETERAMDRLFDLVDKLGSNGRAVEKIGVDHIKAMRLILGMLDMIYGASNWPRERRGAAKEFIADTLAQAKSGLQGQIDAWMKEPMEWPSAADLRPKEKHL